MSRSAVDVTDVTSNLDAARLGFEAGDRYVAEMKRGRS
jgi:hypothetical protein